MLLEDVARVRITQDFLDFVRPRLPDLLRTALAEQEGFTLGPDGVLRIPVPDARLFDIGVAEATLRQAQALLWLDDLERRVGLRFATPDQIRLTLEDLRLGLDGRLQGDIVTGDFSCPVTGDLGAAPSRHAAEISVEAVMDPAVGPRPAQTLDVDLRLERVRLDDLDLRVLGSSAYCAEPQCRDCALVVFGTCLDPGGRCVECHIACGGIASAASELTSALLGLLRPILTDALRPALDELLGEVLRTLNDQPARFEDQLSIAELTGLELSSDAPIGAYVGPPPGRLPVVDRGTGLGLEIPVNAGAEALRADCVPELPPFEARPGPLPALSGTDGQGRPYHVGATLAAAYLEQVLYAAHRSGALCLELGSEDVEALTQGGFRLNASLLTLLAPDLVALAADAAPVFVELKPLAPPRIALGSRDEVGTDPEGNPIEDWLLQLDLDDLRVAFHVLVEDRYVRAFEVRSRAFVGLDVVVKPDQTLELAVGELRIDGFEETFNELLPGADFAELLPTLIDLVLGVLLDEPLRVDVDLSRAVSGALGGAPVGLRVNELFRDGPDEDFLTLSLTFTASPAASLRLPVETRARLAPEPDLIEPRPSTVEPGAGTSGPRPSTVEPGAGTSGPRAAGPDAAAAGALRPTGRVRLQVGVPHTPGVDLAYQARVDGGLWRVFRRPGPDGVLHFAHPALKMPGPHLIEVRARAGDDPATLDPTPVALDVVVDPLPPTVAARWGDDGLEVKVFDAHTSSPGRLGLEVDRGGVLSRPTLSPWGERSARIVLPAAEIAGRRTRLTGIDGQGHRSAPITVDGGRIIGPARSAPAHRPEPGGCRHLGRPDSCWSVPLLVLLVSAWGLRARRRPRSGRNC